MGLFRWAIIEDPNSTWKLDDSYISDREIRGLENYRIVNCLRA